MTFNLFKNTSIIEINRENTRTLIILLFHYSYVMKRGLKDSPFSLRNDKGLGESPSTSCILCRLEEALKRQEEDRKERL